MATNIAWQPTSFQNMSFDPNRGLAIASRASQNITDTIAAQEEAQSLAAYRQSTLDAASRKQDFIEGAPKRAEALRIAALKRSAEQGLLASQFADEAGGSRFDETMLDPEVQADPRFKSVFGNLDDMGPRLPEQINTQKDFEAQAIAQNKRVFSDPTTYRDTVSQKLLESGKFTREEANTIATEKTTQLFPTMDKDVALKLFDKGTGGAGTGAGTGRAGKQLFKQASPSEDRAMKEDFFSINQITSKRSSSQLPEFFGGGRILDLGAVDINQTDVNKLLADMAQTSTDGTPGVNTREALKYLQTRIKEGTMGMRIDKLSPDEVEAFRVGARTMLPGQERTAGATARAGVAERRDFNRGILSRLNPDQSTREKRISTFLSGLPGEAPKTVQDTIGTGFIDVDGTSDIPATPQGRGPLLGNVYNEEVQPSQKTTAANNRIMVDPADVPVQTTPASRTADSIMESLKTSGNMYMKGFSSGVDDVISAPSNVAKILGDVGKWGGSKLAQRHIKQGRVRDERVNNVVDSVNRGDISKLDSRHVRLAINESKSDKDKKALEKIFNAVVKQERSRSSNNGYQWPSSK